MPVYSKYDASKWHKYKSQTIYAPKLFVTFPELNSHCSLREKKQLKTNKQQDLCFYEKLIENSHSPLNLQKCTDKKAHCHVSWIGIRAKVSPPPLLFVLGVNISLEEAHVVHAVVHVFLFVFFKTSKRMVWTGLKNECIIHASSTQLSVFHS